MSPELVSGVIYVFALVTIASGILGDILLIFLLVSYFSKRKFLFVENFVSFISRNVLSFALLVVIVATSGSLFLSEVAGFVPCKLCWMQRIFMYPMTVILVIAVWKEDRKVFRYILPLALIGLSIATYHYLMQLFPQSLSCSDELAACSKMQYANFGFVSIPLMSLVSFYCLSLLSYIGIKIKEK